MEALIREPLKEVDLIFEECKKDVPATMNRVFEFFHDKLEFSSVDMLKIPTLNSIDVAKVRTGTLVRFRGMIQDMYDPEYFIPCYKQGSQTLTSLFRDPVGIDDAEFSYSSFGTPVERSTWHVIAIPGENAWVNEGYSKMAMDIFETPVKKMKTQDAESTDLGFPRARCFPLETNQRSCIVKSYVSENVRLNDLVEVVGVLSHLPESSESIVDETDSAEFNFKNPSTYLVPRIHAVYAKKLRHENPLLDDDIACESAAQRRYVLIEALKCHRELLEIFTPLFYGDEHCAEYLLMHIISRIHMRHGLFPLGKFSLNLVGVSQEQGQAIARILSLLVTKCHYMPMTRDFLNIASFIPKKDNEANRLMTGVLQLSSGTILICDENALTAGQLNSQGVQNVRALQSVVENQTLAYDFTFHQLEFETDIPVLNISIGKGLVRCDYQTRNIPNQPKGTMAHIVEGIERNLTDTILKKLRTYITVVKWNDYQFSEEMKIKVENDFAKMRSEGCRMSADQLHSHLVVARYQSVLRGETELTEGCWQRSKALEKERLERIGL